MAQRIALVTGGMGGLGEAICMKLEKMGLTVVVTYSPGNTKYKDWLREMEASRHKFHAFACEVARKGVTINTISPGYIGTKMVLAIPKDVLDTKIIPQIPMGRLGKPDEVAGLCAYLASDEAAFLTGANIAINGGQHMQ